MIAVAVANTNIALCKYWGKRDAALNLPSVGSLSLTLDGLSTRTEVAFEAGLVEDTLTLNGKPADAVAVRRVARLLDLVRARAGIALYARVVSANDFPTAAGLASSASAFAALALAATRAAGLELPARELSILARRGSGSAARSLFGGLVYMHRGLLADGSDCFAEPIDGAAELDLVMVIGVASEKQKETLSTDGMQHTAQTSPFYRAWVDSTEGDLAEARRAIAARDLEALGTVTERSCLTMHASALAAQPAVVYFRGVTIDGLHAIQTLRKQGVPAWFTCDAGPHPKALTTRAHAPQVAAAMAAVPGVLSVRSCQPGRAAHIVLGGAA